MLRRLTFDLWYLFSRPPWDTNISPPELLRFIESHPPGRALDLGCGTGTNVITLARAGWHVTGVDFSLRAVALARRKARQAGVQVELRTADVTCLDFSPHSFDLILDIGCFHSLTPRGQAATARGIQSWLTDGGTFLLYAVLKDAGQTDFGLTEGDLALFAPLRLVHRADGVNPGQRQRPSAWFEFVK